MSDVRCVVVLNQDLASGKAANAAAVIALSLGQRHPGLVGHTLSDAHGQQYPGLIPVGIPILSADNTQLRALLARCREQQLDVVLFPREGQMTVDYAAFAAAVSEVATGDLQHLGLGITGDKKALRKLTASLKLFG